MPYETRRASPGAIPQASPSPLALGSPSSSGTPAARPVDGVVRSIGHLEPARPLSFLHESSWGTSGLPCVPPLIIDGEWLKSVFGSSSVGGPMPGRIPREVCSALSRAPAPSHAPGGGLPPRGPPHAPLGEGDAEDVLRRARERRALREEFLQRAADAVSRIGAELLTRMRASRPKVCALLRRGTN